ncbi:MAG: alkaline phosphatase PhoX [Geminicoccaceae bacterium]
MPSIQLSIISAALLATTVMTAQPTHGAEQTPGLTRFATVPLDAEITGLYITASGDLFYNAQHPADSNKKPYDKATIGALVGVDWHNLPMVFPDVKVPETDDEKQSFSSALGQYQILAQEGDEATASALGAIIAIDGTVIKQSNDPDFNAFIPTSADGREGYLFTNWEDRPGGMSRMHLTKAADGSWQIGVRGVEMLDFSSVNGTWVNCFGSVSPWNTPLTSEELYFKDTAHWNDEDFEDHDGVAALARYLGRFPNPYDQGYIVEIKRPVDTPAPVKHFSMGRFSHENSVIMPDGKTAYLTDDGIDVVFFKFIADAAGDLSSGTLYAAKVTQDEGNDPATTGFGVEWIELAHGDNATIEGWIDEYDGVTTADYSDGSTNYISDEEIVAWAAGLAADDRVAFLESRKAAAAKGATAEFMKMEGIMINHDRAADGSVPFMYMAMSSISKGMSDEEGDIQLSKNICGVVYQMPLEAGYDVTTMTPAVAGFGYDGGAEVNQCATGGISNPDNLLVLDDGRVLIGEDTGNHENNMLWVWNPDARS